MKGRRFTQEQLNRVNNIDLVDMLMKQGEKLKKEGRVYRWLRYDSTVIYQNKWFRHSRQIGGGPIQFVKEFYGYDFVDAVKYLLNGEDGAEFVQTNRVEYIKPQFKMPKLSRNMNRTFAYLIQTRKIDPAVVQYFVGQKKIFETEEHHNVAFCGYDENGEIKQMHMRSTMSNKKFFQDVQGSDKQYYFRHIGTGNDVYVFEAAIDMLSYISMHQENWQAHSYVCLGGVAMDALDHVLRNNPQIDMVHMCADHDQRGDEVTERIGRELTERQILMG